MNTTAVQLLNQKRTCSMRENTSEGKETLPRFASRSTLGTPWTVFIGPSLAIFFELWTDQILSIANCTIERRSKSGVFPLQGLFDWLRQGVESWIYQKTPLAPLVRFVRTIRYSAQWLVEWFHCCVALLHVPELPCKFASSRSALSLSFWDSRFYAQFYPTFSS